MVREVRLRAEGGRFKPDSGSESTFPSDLLLTARGSNTIFTH
jgi:hypothetical protein